MMVFSMMNMVIFTNTDFSFNYSVILKFLCAIYSDVWTKRSPLHVFMYLIVQSL